MNLENSSSNENHVKTKLSKIAITSFVLSILSLFIGIWAGVSAIILAVIAMKRIKASQRQLKGKGFAVAGLTISLFLCPIVSFVFLLSFDAPPIPNDYTIADLRSAGPEYAESYNLLMSLANEEGTDPNSAPAIGLSAEEVKIIEEVYEVISAENQKEINETLTAHAENIMQLWEKAQKGREIINKLSEYDQIADLIEPNPEAEITFLYNMKKLSNLYMIYAFFQCKQGNVKEAAIETIRLDSVFRKLNINARGSATKVVCYLCHSSGLRTANFIINNPHTSQEIIEVLAAHFTPLKDEQLSLRNLIISEYLIFRDVLDDKKLLKEVGIQRFMQKSPFLKKNSTLRLSRNYCEKLIDKELGLKRSDKAEFSVWPRIYIGLPNVSIDSEGKLPRYYTCYNLIGSIFIQVITPTYESFFERKTRLQVRDDLFQIMLNKRLGREVSLKARAWSDEYIIDMEKNMIFSPGPDKKAYTKDDITLEINPEVINN